MASPGKFRCSLCLRRFSSAAGRDLHRKDAHGAEPQPASDDTPIPGVDPGTPETRAKRRSDVIANLRRAGGLLQEQVNAAEEIRRVLEAWSKASGLGAQDLSSVTGGGLGPGSRDAWLLLSEVERAIWRKKFAPWVYEEAHTHLSGRSTVSRLTLVEAVVIDNCAPRALDKVWHLMHGTCRDALKESLFRYCEIAGWIQDRSALLTK